MNKIMIKIVAFSDTHRKRPDIKESGDILIFAGDDDIYNVEHLADFVFWFKDLNFTHKIMIAGNHDFYLQNVPFAKEYLKENNVVYLEDSSVEVEGLKIYGSPYTPTFMSWAFMEDEAKLGKRFNKIPKDIDILVTHGPAYGALDQIVPGQNPQYNKGKHLGSVSLKETVDKLQNLKYHIFGHIHGSYGSRGVALNASICDEQYNPVNKPIVVCIDKEEK